MMRYELVARSADLESKCFILLIYHNHLAFVSERVTSLNSEAGFSLIGSDAEHFLVVRSMFMGTRLSHHSLKPWQHELKVKCCPVWALIKWYQLVFWAQAGGPSLQVSDLLCKTYKEGADLHVYWWERPLYNSPQFSRLHFTQSRSSDMGITWAAAITWTSHQTSHH